MKAFNEGPQLNFLTKDLDFLDFLTKDLGLRDSGNPPFFMGETGQNLY